MEGRFFSHTRAIKPEEYEIAMAELGETGAVEGAAR